MEIITPQLSNIFQNIDISVIAFKWFYYYSNKHKFHEIINFNLISEKGFSKKLTENLLKDLLIIYSNYIFTQNQLELLFTALFLLSTSFIVKE